MADTFGTRWRRRLPIPAAVAAALAAVVLVSPASAVAPDAAAVDVGLGRMAGEEASVVEVVLAGADELDRLVATGVDLDHHVTRSEQGVVVHAVVTPSEAAALGAAGFRLGNVVHRPGDSQAR